MDKSRIPGRKNLTWKAWRHKLFVIFTISLGSSFPFPKSPGKLPFGSIMTYPQPSSFRYCAARSDFRTCSIHGREDKHRTRAAITVVKSMSSAIPEAIFPMMLAVAGTMTTGRPPWPGRYALCPGRTGSNISVTTGLCDMVLNVRSDKLLGRSGHDHLHVVAILLQLVDASTAL